MQKLFARQLAKATRETGDVDLVALGELVAGAYQDSDRDRRRTDRSMASMIDELGEVHQRLVDAFEAIPSGMASKASTSRWWTSPSSSIIEAMDRSVRRRSRSLSW